MSTAPFHRLPVLQIRPSALLVYERVEWDSSYSRKQKGHQLSNLKAAPTYQGLISPGSSARLKRAIQLLLAIAKPKKVLNPSTKKFYSFKVNFVTLTLPAPQGVLTDKQIKEAILDPWIKSAKRIFGLKNYIWRAEKQMNGNIHFHLATDCYIWHRDLRDSWNKRLELCGFISAFEKKHGHRDPNSTDVHAVKYIRNFAAYLTKYVTKGKPIPGQTWSTQLRKSGYGPISLKEFTENEKIAMPLEAQKINGKIWDCSMNLKHKGNCEFLLENEAFALWNWSIENKPQQTRHSDMCSIIYFEPDELMTLLKGPLKAGYLDWLKVIENIPDQKTA